MTFALSHWDRPRQTIANRYADNDIGYMAYQTRIAFEVLRAFDLRPSEAANMSILDYGCGTGRAATALASVFGRVVGYDPNVHCITTAYRETERCELPQSMLARVTLTTSVSDIGTCDIAYSQNVIEHLADAEATVMVNNLASYVTGPTYIVFSVTRNERVMRPFFSPERWSELVAECAARNANITSAVVDFSPAKLPTKNQSTDQS